jgi:lia operon protein LiaF
MKQKSTSSELFLGLLLVGLGALFLFTSFSFITLFHLMKTYWPALLIFYGAYLLLNARQEPEKSKPLNRHSQPAAMPTRQSVLFGDLDLSFEHLPTPSGRHHVTFGNIRVDADRLNLQPGQNDVHLSVAFGDIRVRTLRELPVKISAGVSFGDVKIYGHANGGFSRQHSYESPSYASAETRLYLICEVTFGVIKVL